jgi:thiamine transporter
MFSVTFLGFRKIKIPLNNIIPFKVVGSWDCDPAERTAECCRPNEPEPDNTGGGKNLTETSLSAQKVKVLAEATIFIALTIVLKDVLPPIFHMPQGGSVTVAGLVPLLWFALRRGLKYGLLAGFVYGIIHAFLPGSYIINPLQGLLDYPLAFAALGLAGAVKKIPVVGIAIGIVGRFLCSFAAGIIFFTSLSIDGVLGSAIYNGVYLIPEFAITAVVIYILLKRNLLNIYM